jgi:hypothetical protein
MKIRAYSQTGFWRNFTWKSFSLWSFFLFIAAILVHIVFSLWDDEPIQFEKGWLLSEIVCSIIVGFFYSVWFENFRKNPAKKNEKI